MASMAKKTSPKKFDEAKLIQTIQEASALHQNKDYVAARKLYQKALKMLPGEAKIINLIGKLELDAGNLDLAKMQLEKALKLAPNNGDTFANLGEMYYRQSEYEQAIAYLERAIRLNPKDHSSWYMMGMSAKSLGLNQQAEDSLSNSILAAPSADACRELGYIQMINGQIDDAEINCKKAIAMGKEDPQNFTVYAELLFKQDKFADGLKMMTHALNMDPENDGTIIAFYECLYNFGMSGNLIDNHFCDNILKCLRSEAIDHSRIGSIWSRCIMLTDEVQRAIKTFQDDGIIDLSSDEMRTIMRDPLINHGLKKVLVQNIAFENFLRHTRKMLLMQRNTIAWTPELSGFLHSLCQQCFLNEFVFFEDDEEQQTLEELSSALASETIEITLLYGCYRHLHKHPNAETLKKRLQASENAETQSIVTTMIDEPLEEIGIKKTIKSLSPIQDKVSQNVQEQYEENPYPRWKVLGKKGGVRTFYRNILKRAETGKKKEQILIAGCGTGRHSLGVAREFPNHKILAVDLSTSSLSYAIRKTKELGFKNVRYLQADILKLEELGQTFDIIESSGVLHHMEDPLAGWQVLTNLLNDGGIMKIGLYSELARASVVEARDIIADMGYESNDRGIRQMREYIKDNKDNKTLKAATEWNDFFSLSMCRDLLFHAQEHRYTIAKLKNHLQQLGLELSAMQISNSDKKSQYLSLNPEDISIQSFEKIGRFEEGNPTTFKSMYQFYVVKTPK